MPYIPTTVVEAAVSGGLTVLFDETLLADTTTIDTGAGGIPPSHDHLLISLNIRTTQAQDFSGGLLRFNNDSSAIYQRQSLRGSNVTASAGNGVGGTSILIECPGSTVLANVCAAELIWIPNYAQTTFLQVLVGMGGWASSDVNEQRDMLFSGVWESTDAIDQIQIIGSGSSDLVAGTRMMIYGV